MLVRVDAKLLNDYNYLIIIFQPAKRQVNHFLQISFIVVLAMALRTDHQH